MVQVNPSQMANEGLLTEIRVLAARHGLGAHGIRLYDAPERSTLELHLEVNEGSTLQEAHTQVDGFETELRNARPGIGMIVTHLEPTGEATAAPAAEIRTEPDILSVVYQLPRELGVEFHPHAIQTYRTGQEIALSFHCILAPEVPITTAHDLTVRIEERLRKRLPRLGRVVIHVEPPAGATDFQQP